MINVPTTHVPASPSLDAVITDLADFADLVDLVDPADFATPFLRPTAEPWLARGFLAAGHVTVLTGDAYAHGSTLALAWAASLAGFRPHGAFVPFAPFASVVDDRASHEGEQRRRLADFAGILGVFAPTLDAAVCLAPYADARAVLDGRALFRAEERRAGFRFYPTSAMDALVDRVKRLNAGLLVVSTLDTVTPGASTSADLARDALRVMADVAARHRIAVLALHDSPRRGAVDPVARVIFDAASIVSAPAFPRIQAHGRSRSRHRVTRRDIHHDGARPPRPCFRRLAGPRAPRPQPTRPAPL